VSAAGRTAIPPVWRFGFSSGIHRVWRVLVSKRTGVVCEQRWVWVTSTVDGADHAVTDTAMAAGLAARQGLFLASCGTGVAAAAMVTPPGQRCTQCQAFIHPQPTSQSAATRRRLVGWLSTRWRC
jgi:hypothetical protein